MDKKLFEILTVDNVGIDTKMKYMESSIRKIFVIEGFHLISMLIKSITQNTIDSKVSIRQFPSPEHPYIVFPHTQNLQYSTCLGSPFAKSTNRPYNTSPLVN